MAEEREEQILEPQPEIEADALVVDAVGIAAESVEEGAAPEACTAEEDAAARCACLEAQLMEAEQKAAEYLNGWQRAQANFENYRKRTEAEQVNLRKAANAALLMRLLPVLDDFARAFQSLPAELAADPWIEGLRLIQRKVNAILEAEDAKPIVLEPGEMFNPNYHQAVLYQEVAGFEDGQIVTEVEQGYVLGDRVLRPSMVVVAKAPPPPAPEPAVDEAVEADAEVLEDAPLEDIAPADSDARV